MVQQTIPPNAQKARSGELRARRMRAAEANQLFYCLRRTPFGPVAVVWSVHRERPRIRRVLLSKPELSAERLVQTTFPDVRRSSCAEIDLVADQIMAFLTGEDIRFSLDIAHLDLCSQFQQKVLRAEHGIPRGSVSTYQRIANHLGNRNGARAVGTALATNPFPIIIPCHRAIRSDGTLGGYQGGLGMKQTLLKMEGIFFDASGRVVTGELFY
jgi:methylated-DNA-[protein]-cysteine S-methyltransferase